MTAVFAANDQMALGLCAALREHGRRVPEDVSVVGFDDLPESAFFAPPLTTVRQDFAELGRRAMVLVERVLAGEENASVDLVPTTLVVRASTAPPPPPALRPTRCCSETEPYHLDGRHVTPIRPEGCERSQK